MKKKTPVKVKTIDVNAREWFDKVNGNSYFTAIVIINYGTKSAQSFNVPFQYGYGDQYLFSAKQLLKDMGYISDINTMQLRTQGIIVRGVKLEGKKSWVKELVA